MLTTLFILPSLAFNKKYSTSFALNNLTQTFKEALDPKKYCWGVFIDFPKAFDIVDHNIVMGKLKHYGIKVAAFIWFVSYLKERKQHVLINAFNSKDLPISHVVQQSSFHGPFLFFLYINDLRTAIKFCNIHNFSDDTNLLHRKNFIKKLNKCVNSTWEIGQICLS